MTKKLDEARKAGIRVRDIKLGGGRLIQLSDKSGLSYVYFNESDSLGTLKFKVETLNAHVNCFLSHIKNA